jgi:hypothetical protein
MVAILMYKPGVIIVTSKSLLLILTYAVDVKHFDMSCSVWKSEKKLVLSTQRTFSSKHFMRNAWKLDNWVFLKLISNLYLIF